MPRATFARCSCPSRLLAHILRRMAARGGGGRRTQTVSIGARGRFVSKNARGVHKLLTFPTERRSPSDTSLEPRATRTRGDAASTAADAAAGAMDSDDEARAPHADRKRPAPVHFRDYTDVDVDEEEREAHEAVRGGMVDEEEDDDRGFSDEEWEGGFDDASGSDMDDEDDDGTRADGERAGSPDGGLSGVDALVRQLVLEADTILCADAVNWPQVTSCSLRACAKSILARSAAISDAILSRRDFVKGTWFVEKRGRPELLRRVAAIVLVSTLAVLISSPHQAAAIAAIVCKLYPYMSLTGMTSPENPLKLTKAAGLGSSTKPRSVTCKLFAPGELESVEIRVGDAPAAVVASMLSFEGPEELMTMSSGPFLAFPVEKGVVDASGIDVAQLYAEMLADIELRNFTAARAHTPNDDDAFTPPALYPIRQSSSSSSRSAAGASSSASSLSSSSSSSSSSSFSSSLHPPADCNLAAASVVNRCRVAALRGSRDVRNDVLRVPSHVFRDPFFVDKLFQRTIVRCDSGDAMWREMEAAAGADALERIQEAAVPFGGHRYAFRVAEMYEDSIDAWEAAWKLQATYCIYRAYHMHPFLVPIGVCRDGVAVSFHTGRSAVPVMAGAMCGRSWKWWSPQNVATLAVGAKLTGARNETVEKLDEKRVSMFELRSVVLSIAETLEAAIAQKPKLVVRAADGTVFVPLPFLQLCLLDLAEEQTQAARVGNVCMQCAVETPLLRWRGVLDMCSCSAFMSADTLLNTPSDVIAQVEAEEEAVAARTKVAFRDARSINAFPVLSLEGFAERLVVCSDGISTNGIGETVNVMLRIPLTRGGKHGSRDVFVGDAMHLLNLLINHSLEAVLGILQGTGSMKTFKDLWLASCSRDVRTYGCAGAHMHSIACLPPDANERIRYAYMVRMLLVAALWPPGDSCAEVWSTMNDLVLPVVDIIMEFFAPHDRVNGATTSVLNCVRAARGAHVFKAKFLARCPHTGTKQQLTHHIATHSFSSWMRFGSPAFTSMSAFEFVHRNTRDAVQASSRQDLNTDPSVARVQSMRTWRLEMQRRIASQMRTAPLHRVNPGRTGGIPHGSPAENSTRVHAQGILEAVESALDTLRSMGVTMASLRPSADRTSDCELPHRLDDCTVTVSSTCWVPVHGYLLEMVGTVADEVPPVPPLLAAQFVSVEQPEDEKETSMPETRVGVFLMSAAVALSCRGRNITLLVGHEVALGRRTECPLRGVLKEVVEPEARANVVCVLQSVGGVLGAAWAPTPTPSSRTLVTVGPVHPALVALKGSWLR